MAAERNSREIDLVLYSPETDFPRVRQVFVNQLEGVTRTVEENGAHDPGEDRLAIRLQDGSLFQVTVSHDPEFLQPHLAGMSGFFSRADCSNPELQQNVLTQISLFTCAAACHFPLDEDRQRTESLIGTVRQAAKVLHGLVLFPSMELVDGEGNLILSADGRTDMLTWMPVRSDDLVAPKREEDPVDRVRRERSLAILRARKIPCFSQLPPVVREEDALIRPVEEITRRLFAAFAVCVYCESRQEGSREEAMTWIDEMDALTGGRLWEWLTPMEAAFLREEEPTRQDMARFGWRYECCHVFLWALGHLPLGYPDHICDVERMARMIWDSGSPEEFMTIAVPVQGEDLLDAADLVLRYHWACVEERIHHREMPAGLNEEVVYEWHYALNWLVGADNAAEWDDVSPHT